LGDHEVTLPEHEYDALRERADRLQEQVHRLQTTLAAMTADITRPDGKQRMTTAQMRTLWIACGNYNVPFREDDYRVIPLDASISPGYVEGWVGGNLHAAGNPRHTIYLGVDPEGRSNS
jgi:hypothetical protein